MLTRKKSQNVAEVKVVFDIAIRTLTLKKPGAALEKDCTLSILIERGSKHLTTSEKEVRVNPSTGDAVIVIADTLSLEATMHQAGLSGGYQEKTGKLTVRKKKRGMMTSHISIGALPLPLHSFLENGDQPIDRTFVLEQCPFPGSQIALSIRFRRLDGKPTLVSQNSQSTSISATAATDQGTIPTQQEPAPSTSDGFDDPFAVSLVTER